MVDEISMVGSGTFGHLDLALKPTMSSSSPFGGVSLWVVGDVLQVGLFMEPGKGSYRSFTGWLLEKFHLHELVEIVQESNNPVFVQLLIRVWEGQEAIKDVIQIKRLANTNTTTWPD